LNDIVQRSPPHGSIRWRERGREGGQAYLVELELGVSEDVQYAVIIHHAEQGREGRRKGGGKGGREKRKKRGKSQKKRREGGREGGRAYLVELELGVPENIEDVIVAHDAEQVLVGEEVGAGLLDPLVILEGNEGGREGARARCEWTLTFFIEQKCRGNVE